MPIPECPASPVKLTSNVGPSTPTRSTAPSAKVAPIAGSSSGMPIYVGTTPTSSKLNTPSTTHTVSPSSSSQASSPAKSNAPNSPQRLRHPSRLHSRDLNGNTFRIYVKHYMDRTAYIDSTPEADYEPDIPEPPSSPSKRSFQLANDTTPRPSASRVSMSMQTPRPRIPPLSYDGHPPPRASAVARGSPGMKCFTLSYLRRVPELADMAQRVVKAVTKRRLREERQKAKEAAAVAASVSRSSSSTHPSTSSRTSTSSTQTEGKSGPRIKRLFQATIVQLLREGSIVLWDGPTHTCPTADVPKEQTSGLWKANLTSVSADSTVFSTTSVSMAGDDEEELVLSDPEANEEAYVPLSPGFLAGVVEEAIGKLTRALKVFDARKGKEVTKCGTTTKEGILAHLRKDDRWRYLSEWNIGEALDVLKAERRAWFIGGLMRVPLTLHETGILIEYFRAPNTATMEALKLQKKYPEVTRDEMFNLINRFNSISTDSPGRVDKSAVLQALQSSGESYDQARETLKSVSVDASGKVELEDWVELNVKLRSQAASSSLTTKAGKVTVKGSNANVSHTINEDERTEFTNHINLVIENDPDIGDRYPIPTNTMQLFDECKDGLVLCKLINDSVPDTIDARVLNKPTARKPLNAFQITENNNIVVTSAKAIGCSVVNIGSTDLSEGREHLILGLIWQIIRRGLLAQVDIKIHPELYRLCEDGETIDDLLRLTPDQILLRWFNYHLKAAGWKRRVNNFSRDVSDGENYTVLLHQLQPEHCSLAPLQTADLRTRAEQVLQNADKIKCRKFLTPSSLVSGNPRLNLAFVANLFNTHPGLEPLDEQEAKDYGAVEDFDAEGEREARVFTLWLNSLNVDPGVFNFFENLKDGLIILQAYDKVLPGSVVWRRVSKPKEGAGAASYASGSYAGEGDEEAVDIGVTPNQSTLSRFKAVENTNYAVELGKQNGMHLVGIQGADITDGRKTLVLGLVWQLMRMSISKTLSDLSKSSGGKPITDTEILKWANSTAQRAKPDVRTIRSFKEPSITTGLFFLDLLDAIRPGIVDPNLIINVSESGPYDDRRQNAKLAISIARKMNALIFLVPEDIVDVRPRLILTFVGSLMSIAQQ
ncbi:hypothetical protein DXG01_006697 [Tephrocybe rancida]|nr:hypothetical protein DXG01_006697 [Tephrocybe rancida]